MKTIVLTGGGTAGHIMPHLALLPTLKNHFNKIVYIGSDTGMENNIIPKYPEIEFHTIKASKLDRAHIFKNFTLPFKFIKSVCQAKQLLRQIRPNIIFSKGGYVSLPVVFAAKSLKIPVVAHESDLSVGLANKLCKPKVNAICTTFEKTAHSVGKKGIFTGSPIIENQNVTLLKKTKPILFITGGSLGAKAINDAVFDAAKELTKSFYVIHQVGKNKTNKSIKLQDYEQIEFATDMMQLIKSADIVVSRAGSNTIFELAYNTKPMLLIPLPKGASRGDQIDNAKYFESKNYAKVLFQENLSSKTLISAINELYDNKNQYISTLKNAKIPNGTDKIVKIILKNQK